MLPEKLWCPSGVQKCPKGSCFNPIVKVSHAVQLEAPGPDTLYAEKQLKGYSLLKPNLTGTESGINLELLFNAVISSADKMRSLFKEEPENG